jgi:hypothetical protein
MTTLTSGISTIYIDTTFPIAGQDNDTQGFRTNFTTIKNNFDTAKTEIQNILANVAASPSLTSTLPASITALGTVGQLAYGDNNPAWLCIANNYWQRIPTIANTAPATSTSVGNTGQIAYDSSHIYVCIATNTWVRASLATW